MAAIELPKIPKDIIDMLFNLFEQYISQEVNRLGNSLRDKFEREWTDKLKSATIGDEFLFLTVSRIDPVANTVTLLYRAADVSVKMLPQLKLALARAEICIDPWINLTDSQKPLVNFRGITSFAIEIDIKRESYQLGIGYSQDDHPDTKSKQMLVGVRWNTPQFYLFGILGESEKGGLLIDVMGDTPFAIPLGPTGIALKGIGLLYGERFAPLLPGATPQNAMKRMASAEAVEYANWAAAGKSLETWIAVDEDLRMFGISATIVDGCTCGKVFKAEQAGVAYLSFGPTLVFKGGLRVLDFIEAGELVGVIDFRSQSIFGRATQSFDIIPNELCFVASVELSASLRNQNHTYVAFGGYHMNGCHVVVINLLHLIGGSRFVPLQGSATRGAGQVLGSGEICGFGGGYSLAVDLATEVGWNPICIGGHLGISGSAWIKVFGKKLGLGIGLVTDIQIAEPLIFTLDLVFTLNLCWPLDDLHFPVEVFAYKDRRPADPLAPLKFGPLDPLSWYHGPSGAMGKLTANDTKLWPDVVLSVDFQRQAGRSDIIVNPSNGAFDEANVKVEHQFHELKIEKRNPDTNLYELVKDVRASWLLSANEGKSETTNRLAIPCNDPLGWLNRFDYAQPPTIEPVDRPKFQTFGAGPSHFFDIPSGGGSVQATFEEVDIGSPKPFWLIPLSLSDSYHRVLVGRQFEISFSTKLPSGNLPIATSAFELRLLWHWAEPPQIGISNGTASSAQRVRRLDNSQAEWLITISRTPSQHRLPLIMNSEQAFELAAIGYRVSRQILNPVPDLPVLKPGLYRLTIKGMSSANYRSTASDKSPIWNVIQAFEIIPPPTRPYVRYSTLGDERIFGLEFGGWNPNPRGAGFGHYQDHFGQIRASVGYLSKIYPRLWIATSKNEIPTPVTIQSSAEGTLAGARASQEWRVATGLPIPIEEELTFVVPHGVGSHQLLVCRSLLNDGTDIEVVDEWSYRISRFANPVEHLTPSLNGLSHIFGPFGSRPVQYVPPLPIPAHFDFDAVPESKLRPDWILPAFFGDITGVQDPQVGLWFLRVLNWCGIFEADPSPNGEGIMVRPEHPDVCALFDSGRAPLAMLLRTSEPCDWRRVDVSLVVGPFDMTGERLATKLVPSHDGCSCLVIAIIEGLPVRLPRASIAMRLLFTLQSEGLPRLTVADAPTRLVEEIQISLNQPYGHAW